MLGDFPRNARYVRGFLDEDVSIGTEEADERAFLFGGNMVLMHTTLPLGLPGSMRTSLVPSTGSKDPMTAWGQVLLRRPPS